MRLAAIPRLPLFALQFLAAGTVCVLFPDATVWSDRIWLAGLLICGMPVVWRTFRELLRGHFASDVVAMLAIVGAIALGQPLAGLVVVLMQTGGEALEAYAVARASSAVQALEADAPAGYRCVAAPAAASAGYRPGAFGRRGGHPATTQRPGTG